MHACILCLPRPKCKDLLLNPMQMVTPANRRPPRTEDRRSTGDAARRSCNPRPARHPFVEMASRGRCIRAHPSTSRCVRVTLSSSTSPTSLSATGEYLDLMPTRVAAMPVPIVVTTFASSHDRRAPPGSSLSLSLSARTPVPKNVISSFGR